MKVSNPNKWFYITNGWQSRTCLNPLSFWLFIYTPHYKWEGKKSLYLHVSKLYFVPWTWTVVVFFCLFCFCQWGWDKGWNCIRGFFPPLKDPRLKTDFFHLPYFTHFKPDITPRSQLYPKKRNVKTSWDWTVSYASVDPSVTESRCKNT